MALLSFLIRWSWLFGLGIIAAVVPAVLLAKESGTTYQSTATMLVVNDPEASERLTNSYAELVKIRPVLDLVRQRLALNETSKQLGERINVESNFNSQLIKINVEHADPALAAQIANTTSDVVLMNVDSLVGKPGTMRIAETAEPAPEPARQSVAMRAGLAGGLGLLVALSIAIGVDSLKSGRAERNEHEAVRDVSPRPMS